MKAVKYYIPILCALFSALSCTKESKSGDGTPFVFEITSVKDFNAQSPDNDYYYYLSGTIGEIVDEANTQFVLSDKTGDVVVWGLRQGLHGKRIRNMGGYKTGDAITICALKGKFTGEPYAKDAFVVDPQKEKVWITPTNPQVSADANELVVNIFTDAKANIAASESWIHIGEADGTALKVTVDANESIFPRIGYINVRTEDINTRVRLTQVGKVIPLQTIAEAISSSYTRVEGTVLSIVTNGYLLGDKTGVIFIETDKMTGIYTGTTCAVTGAVKTEGYMTRIVPELVQTVPIDEFKPENPKQLSTADVNSLVAATLAKSATAPGSLKYEYITVTGTLVFIDGKTRLVENGTVIKAEPYNVGKELDLDNMNGHTLKLVGYPVAIQDGTLEIILTGYEDIPIETAITIDGDFSDWAAFPDLAPGHDMSESHNLKPVIKLHSENGYVFGYYRLDKSEESVHYMKDYDNSGDYYYLMKMAARFYVWIDNDDAESGQGGGRLFEPKRYDHVICYRTTKSVETYNAWVTFEPRTNEYYAEAAFGEKHTDSEMDKNPVGYIAVKAEGDILEGEFSFLAAKVGLYGKSKTVLGLESGWDNIFNPGAASLGREGYEIELN